jgi:hypothetical protein
MSAEQSDAPDMAAGQALPDLELIFAPTWARAAPAATRHGGAGGDGRNRRDDYQDRQGERSERRDGARPPRRDGARPPRRDGARPPRRDGPRPPRREERFGATRDARAGDRSYERGAPPAAPSPASPPLPFDIRLLPEQKALGAVIRRIQSSRRAYPMRDVMRLFLHNDAALLFRIEPLKDAGTPSRLFQCRVCGMPALSDGEVREHLLRRHLEDFYDVKEVEGEAPSGSFPCVARCGLSGELLGPPNHHSFGLRVQEMLRTRFAHLSEEEYRGRIEMVRDPAVVEQWREANRRRKLYRRKPAADAAEAAAGQAAAEGGEPAPAETPAEEPAPAADAAAEPAPRPPAVERHVAELQFAREIVPLQIGSAAHLVCPVAASRAVPNRRLAAALRARLEDEERRPGSLFFALRGAFRHRGLHLFRVDDARGPEFVMGHAPVPLDIVHAVAEVRGLMAAVVDNPASTRQSLVAALAPAGDEARQASLATHITWLTEKGHLIEFFNGQLAAPSEFPAFRAPAGRNAARAAPTPAAEA